VVHHAGRDVQLARPRYYRALLGAMAEWCEETEQTLAWDTSALAGIAAAFGGRRAPARREPRRRRRE
jgi:hypothetical protein